MHRFSGIRGSALYCVVLLALLSASMVGLAWGDYPVHASGAATMPVVAQRPTLVPPREPLTPTPQPQLVPRLLCLQLTAHETDQSSASTVVYEVIVRNLSQTVRAVQPKVRVPAGLSQGVEVVALPKEAWVAEALPDTLVVALPSLAPGAAVTTTVRVPRRAFTEPVLARARLDWANRRPLIPTTFSNQAIVTKTYVHGPVAGGELAVQRVASGWDLTGAGFTSYERIGVWYQSSDGQTVALPDVEADSQGTIQIALAATVLPAAGEIIAYGTCSQQWLVGRVTL